MFPVGVLILGSIPWHAGAAPMVVATLVLAAFVGSAIGLTLGTLVTPARINILFALILTPFLFTGCSQYPWPSLAPLPWFQWLTTLNPLTYTSEGMRSALVPAVPHMPAWVCLLMLVVSFALFATIGIRGFLRRAIDSREAPPLSRRGVVCVWLPPGPGSEGWPMSNSARSARADRVRRRIN